MKLTLRKNLELLVLTVFVVGMHITVGGQKAYSRMNMDCVALRKIAQKPAPKISVKPAPDVIVKTPDDIHFRFELRNRCDQTIYFLFSKTADETYPAGYMIYRKNKEWRARTPSWRRDGDLTGSTVDWAALKPGEKVEFEYSDLSLIEGERSAAIYINASPTHEGRVELLADPFNAEKH